MARGQKDKSRTAEVAPVALDEANLPPVVPPRKHPLLLLIAALVFASWIAFLGWMAMFG